MQSRTASLFLGLATYLCSVDAGRIHYIAQSPKGSARLEGEAAVTGAPAPSTPALSNLLLKGNPWWAGKSVADARKALAEKQMSGANLAGTGVTDTEDLDLLSDDELYKVFAAGVPDVPGRLPGEESMPATCCMLKGTVFHPEHVQSKVNQTGTFPPHICPSHKFLLHSCPCPNTLSRKIQDLHAEMLLFLRPLCLCTTSLNRSGQHHREHLHFDARWLCTWCACARARTV